jgi:amidase
MTIKDAYEVAGMTASCGLSPLARYGLPMGVQIVGPYLQDRTPLRFAQLVEQALGGFEPPPFALA